VLQLNIRDVSGQKKEIRDLAEPILLSLPISYTLGMECAYWDENKTQWSSEGVTLVHGSEQLVCATSHLSFFGAVMRGMMKSLQCSQASLFTVESYRALGEGAWFYDVGAIILWVMLAFLFGMLASSAYVDRVRAKKNMWSDECFLIAMGYPPNPECVHEEYKVDMVQKGRLMLCLGTVVATVGVTVEVALAALRDVIDEIGSQFFGMFGEVRTFIDGLQGSLADLSSTEAVPGGGESRRVAALVGLSIGMTASTSTRAMATSMWLSLDDAGLIKEGLDMAPENEGEHARIPADTERHNKRVEFLATMQGAIGETCDKHRDALTSWSSLPRMAGRIFLSQTPAGGVFLFSISTSSSLRALLLSSELMGAMALCTFFSSATGPGRSRTRPAPDDEVCEMSGLSEMLGRLIIIGVSSSLVACLPVAMLSKVHSRSFIRMEYEGCDEWMRQLRKWRNQDIFIWVCGILYILFCAHFVMLFFASVVTEDQIGWVASSLISLSEDIIVVPVALALAFPFISMVILSTTAMFLKIERREVLARHKSGNQDSARRLEEKDQMDENFVDEFMREGTIDPKLRKESFRL